MYCFFHLREIKSKKKIETEKRSQTENIDGETRKVKETECGIKMDENYERVKELN